MRIICLAILCCCTGCATILSGKTQNLTIATNPAGASCELTREGKILGAVNPTPGALMVNKTKHDISVVCKKDGYQDATGNLESGTEGATFGNIAAGGLIGWGIDSASGADNKYPEVTTITLIPKEEEPKVGGKLVVASASPKTKVLDKGSAMDRLKRLDELKANNLISEDDYRKNKERV